MSIRRRVFGEFEHIPPSFFYPAMPRIYRYPPVVYPRSPFFGWGYSLRQPVGLGFVEGLRPALQPRPALPAVPHIYRYPPVVYPRSPFFGWGYSLRQPVGLGFVEGLRPALQPRPARRIR